jgi:dihydrofolate reductase
VADLLDPDQGGELAQRRDGQALNVALPADRGRGRSHGSLSMNRALMAAGLVDRVQVTIFPVITGQTGTDPIFQDAADFDLELIESRTLDGNTQELIYRPTLHA